MIKSILDKFTKAIKEPTDLEKYQKWSELCCTLYQHTKLNVAPTWIHGVLDDGYGAESFCVGFEDFENCVSMEFDYGFHWEGTDHSSGRYCYTFTCTDFDDEGEVQCDITVLEDDLSNIEPYILRVMLYFG